MHRPITLGLWLHVLATIGRTLCGCDKLLEFIATHIRNPQLLREVRRRGDALRQVHQHGRAVCPCLEDLHVVDLGSLLLGRCRSLITLRSRFQIAQPSLDNDLPTRAENACGKGAKCKMTLMMTRDD